jgi:4-amino-4-deoxy-L-arabinose transferase-like glycosyltransferase
VTLRNRPLASRNLKLLVAFCLVVAVGISLRWILLASRVGLVDADEAVVGLMARHMLHGQFQAFFWGNAQGGSIEAGLVAVSFKVFGSNGFALKLVPLILSGCGGFLVWRIGLRTMSSRAAQLAVAVYLVGSSAFVWWSTKARGHYSPLLVIELIVVLIAIRMVQREREEPRPDLRHGPRDAALLGLLIGLGWWESPQIAHVAVPALAWILWHLRGRAKYLWLVLPAAFLGALPWFVHNVSHRWESLSASAGEAPTHFVGRVATFFTVALPQILGFRLPITRAWLLSIIGVIAYAACLAAFLISVRKQRSSLIAWVVVLYPILFAISPFNYLGDARYLFFLWPFVALLAGRGLGYLSGRVPVAALATLVGLALFSFIGVQRMIATPPTWNAWELSLPIEPAALRRILERESVRYAYAPYAIAYPISFSSGENIIVTPIRDYRYLPYYLSVEQSTQPAFVLIDRADALQNFEDRLRRLRVAPHCSRVAGFIVCRPVPAVDPQKVGVFLLR